jgi:hypothetical protein
LRPVRDAGTDGRHHGLLRALPATTRLLVAAFGVAIVLPATGEDGGFGTFLVRGNAHVQVSPFPTHDQPGDMRVVIERSGARGQLSLRLTSRGHTCVFGAARAPDGAFDLVPASCRIDVKDPDARGTVEAQLRSGHGTLRGDRLTLDLEFGVSGRVDTRVPRALLDMLGPGVAGPDGFSPPMPVSGTVSSRASGGRLRP